MMTEFDLLSSLDDNDLSLLMDELKANMKLYIEIIARSEQNTELINELINLGVEEELAPKYSILISGILLSKRMKKMN